MVMVLYLVEEEELKEIMTLKKEDFIHQVYIPKILFIEQKIKEMEKEFP